MAYNFPTSGYYAKFGNVPTLDGKKLRQETAEYMKNFDKTAWEKNPIKTSICGQPIEEGTLVDTIDAFGRKNGKQILSPPHVVDQVLGHIKNYKPPLRDYRAPVRILDRKFLTKWGPTIVGNQSFDFEKQDGITELEESIEANCVEQRLNDALFTAEQNGEVNIRRAPVFVGCVSNFSNFLDLCRKVLRHLEIGVPVVVLSRSNTTQHMYRWFELLQQGFQELNIDPGMATYLSCSIEEQRRLFTQCPECPMHFTGSRAIAEKIKEVVPKLMASTGGPNTMVTTEFNEAVGDAARWSNLIENKGQCTAMRHLVCPGLTVEQVGKAWSKAPVVESGLQSIEAGEFAGMFKTQPGSHADKPREGYERPANAPMLNVRVSSNLPKNIEEQWREIYLDVTTPTKADLGDTTYLLQLANWINVEQPISLAVNHTDYELATKLFEMTGLVVYTVGDPNKPALTAQARPQDGEVFGEFPPRHQMGKVSHLPMLVPSPVAGYNAIYNENFIEEKAKNAGGLDGLHPDAITILQFIKKTHVRGYAVAILEYLLDACQGPRTGFGQRTALFGLQRPPINRSMSILRLENPNNWDHLLLYLLPYMSTTAFEQVEVSVSELVTKDLETFLPFRKRMESNAIVVESHDAFTKRRADPSKIYNAFVVDDPLENMLAFQFVARLFPLGHIKSTYPKDEKFVEHFTKSAKWLRVRSA